jgi:hypothetical protein
MRDTLNDPRNRKGVKLTKRIEVFFQKRVAPGDPIPPGVSGEVKAYSPPIDPDALPKGGGVPPKGKQMLDVAIIKIEMTDLPTVHLAGRATHVHLGEYINIIGFPGAVLWHDFLSTETRAAASVTHGRVSGFKLDVNERWVIQTDASISWGNSGGPAFNSQGEVMVALWSGWRRPTDSFPGSGMCNGCGFSSRISWSLRKASRRPARLSRCSEERGEHHD